LTKIAAFLLLGSMKDVKAKGKAFSPQKRTSSTMKHEIFCGSLLPGSGSSRPKSIRIRIYKHRLYLTKKNHSHNEKQDNIETFRPHRHYLLYAFTVLACKIHIFKSVPARSKRITICDLIAGWIRERQLLQLVSGSKATTRQHL
jgi:hypothetical protein